MRKETGRRSELLRAWTSDPEVTKTREIFSLEKGRRFTRWIVMALHHPSIGHGTWGLFSVRLLLQSSSSLCFRFWDEMGEHFLLL